MQYRLKEKTALHLAIKALCVMIILKVSSSPNKNLTRTVLLCISGKLSTCLVTIGRHYVYAEIKYMEELCFILSQRLKILI